MVWPLISPILSHFVSFTFFITILTWISMAIGAAITILVRTDHGMPRTFKGFLRFCFPPEIVRVKTCRVDAFFYVVNRISSPLIVTPLLLGSAFCATLTYQGLTRLYGPHAQEPESTLVWLGPGSFQLGLPDNEGQDYRSVRHLYLTPFINIGKMAQNNLGTKASVTHPVKADPEIMVS